MAEQAKSLTDRVSELTKLVDGVQERLDQVGRALATLQNRLAQEPRERVPAGRGALGPGEHGTRVVRGRSGSLLVRVDLQ
jgi:hypothetical protein